MLPRMRTRTRTTACPRTACSDEGYYETFLHYGHRTTENVGLKSLLGLWTVSLVLDSLLPESCYFNVMKEAFFGDPLKQLTISGSTRTCPSICRLCRYGRGHEVADHQDMNKISSNQIWPRVVSGQSRGWFERISGGCPRGGYNPRFHTVSNCGWCCLSSNLISQTWYESHHRRSRLWIHPHSTLCLTGNFKATLVICR